MRARSLLVPLVVVGLIHSVEADAARSLEQIRYELYKSPEAAVEDDLRRLVRRGDREAMHLLGDVLATQGVAHGESIDLYQRAFNEGKGEVAALGSLAQLMERYPYLRDRYRTFFGQALTRYPHTRDLQTLNTTLQVFLTYPGLFVSDHAEGLIDLHERSCVLSCATPLYRAVLAEHRHNQDEADRWYRQAMAVDARAVERYYEFLGDRQDEAFPLAAEELKPQIPEMSAEIIHRIGMVLDRISDLLHVQEDNQARLLAREAQLAGREIEQDPQAGPSPAERMTQEALQWTELAAARQWPPAMASRFYFMTSSPERYSGDEAMALIDRIEALDPVLAKTLRVSALMVTNWTTLNPAKAHQLIQELMDEGHADAQLLLADLYSRGGLDEPDQERALEIYQRVASQGSPAAYYSQARIYTSGRAICHDHPRAFAYAQVALDLGVVRARSLVKRLDPWLDESEHARAQTIRDGILKELEL